MKRNINHILINTAIENLINEGKPVTLTNIAGETGYKYIELYNSSYRRYVKRQVKVLPTVVQPTIFEKELRPIHTLGPLKPVHLHYQIAERELIVHIEKPFLDTIDDAIEDLEFMLTKAIANLKRMKAKLAE